MLAAVISVDTSNRRFLRLAMKFEDIIFPDFDDIAVPPEPNEDSDRGKEAEQPQVTGQYLNAEKKCGFAANLAC